MQIKEVLLYPHPSVMLLQDEISKTFEINNLCVMSLHVTSCLIVPLSPRIANEFGFCVAGKGVSQSF